MQTAANEYGVTINASSIDANGNIDTLTFVPNEAPVYPDAEWERQEQLLNEDF